MAEKLTRKQIYEMRGRLKAPQRAAALRKRAEYQRVQYEIKVQHGIAKRILHHI